MDLSSFQGAPFSARRDRLARALGKQQALVAAGVPSPRNYLANTYPYRANSHFLYLFGLPLRGAFGLWNGDNWLLFAPEPDPASALWHGPEPTLKDLAEAVGCTVYPDTQLTSHVEGGVQTLPAADARTCAVQSKLLGRAIETGSVAEQDHPLADAMLALRLIHDEAAIAEMRAAVAATVAAHAAGMRATRPGRKESEVRAAMEAEIIGRDLTTAYGSIVTVHGEVLHNEYHHHEIMNGDLLLADVGAESAGGFASDVTRTWPGNGKFSDTQRALYNVVLQTQKALIEAVKPNARYREIHMLALQRMGEGLKDVGILQGRVEDLVEEGAVSLFFPHGTGHLLGLDVHDMEDLGDRAGYAPGRQRTKNFKLRTLRLDRDLLPGMAVTIEPGFYQVPAILQHPELGRDPKLTTMVNWERLAKFADVRGIRIEDDVLVTESGHDVLTAAIPKEMADVEAAVGG
ncbi:MAG: aminopeptidase P family protein [Deltaproteobacteria bacterium]|nr:aminopeptidase P family protein [Deltaproteobacteria bacterium]